MPAARDDIAAAAEAVPVLVKTAGTGETGPATTTNAAGSAGNGVPTEGNKEEDQYLDLVKEILETGEHRPDRYSPVHDVTQPLFSLSLTPLLLVSP